MGMQCMGNCRQGIMIGLRQHHYCNDLAIAIATDTTTAVLEMPSKGQGKSCKVARDMPAKKLTCFAGVCANSCRLARGMMGTLRIEQRAQTCLPDRGSNCDMLAATRVACMAILTLATCILACTRNNQYHSARHNLTSAHQP